VAQLVEALRYKTKVRGFDSRCYNWTFSSFRPHYDLGLTQPRTEMSTRNISRAVKGGRCVGLTTLAPDVLTVFKSGSLNLLEPSGIALLLPLSFHQFSITIYPSTGVLLSPLPDQEEKKS